MKKLISMILSVVIIFTLTAPALAIGENSDQLSTISEVYGIPMGALIALDSETILSLYADANAVNNKRVSSNDTYIKIEITESGNMIMYEAPYDQYLQETRSRENNTNESSGWMRLHTTVFEVDSRTGEASCAFTWLTSPTLRLKDIVGVSLRQGTLNHDTTSGFYSHSSPGENFTYTFKTSDIQENGAGATATFNLRLSDYRYNTSDFAFLRFRFAKEGSSEGVNGSYYHQEFSISLNPTFTIDRSGTITSSSGFNIINYYTSAKGYVSINW